MNPNAFRPWLPIPPLPAETEPAGNKSLPNKMGVAVRMPIVHPTRMMEESSLPKRTFGNPIFAIGLAVKSKPMYPKSGKIFMPTVAVMSGNERKPRHGIDVLLRR